MSSSSSKSKQTDQISTQQHLPIKITSAGSQLQNPRAFILDALQNLNSSWGIAKRLFFQSVAQRYRYSTLGLFWAFVPPAIMGVLLTLGQRAKIAGLSTGTIPPQVYGIFGLVMAQTFLEALNGQRLFLTQHNHLLARQKVPIEGLMLASVAEATFAFLVRFPVLIVILLVFNITPSVTSPLSLFGFATIIGLGTGLGLLLAPWNVLSRDLDSLMQLFPWLLFAVTPAFVAVQPGNWLYYIYMLNPLTYLFEATRWLAYGYGEVNLVALLFLVPLTLILLVIGWLFCRLCLPYIIERSLI